LGGDTRQSTPILGRWLAAELQAAGCEITWLGTVPTPAVAERTRTTGATCGIVVSASHNPHPDNGIKLLDGQGFKWSPTAELDLEDRLQNLAETPPAPDVSMELDHPAVSAYLAHLGASLPEGRPLTGLAIALDTGNGAASPYARRLFEDLGADVTLVHDRPNGQNINAGCGSTNPQIIASLTRESGAAMGFSFDGDADRVILADEQGEVRDGDAILFLWGRDLARRGSLPGQRIVATSMSNLGLEVALRNCGVGIMRCDVGDREVVTTLRREGLRLGGEQSGHIVDLSLSTTGDGLLTALQIAHLVLQNNTSLSSQLKDFERFPQLLHNVQVREKPPFDELSQVVALRDEIVHRLGDSGRLVLRYSGTEPLARIMLEGPDRATIQAMAEELAKAITEAIS
jgi:phosphoglucosamine mutase